jgi:hypothetical protein
MSENLQIDLLSSLQKFIVDDMNADECMDA